MKKMYALNFTNNGNGMDSRPYGSTIAVSTDIEKLRAEMQKCIKTDCLETDDDFEGDEYAHNFQIYRTYDHGNNIEVILESKLDKELTVTYLIHEVEVL